MRGLALNNVIMKLQTQNKWRQNIANTHTAYWQTTEQSHYIFSLFLLCKLEIAKILNFKLLFFRCLTLHYRVGCIEETLIKIGLCSFNPSLAVKRFLSKHRYRSQSLVILQQPHLTSDLQQFVF